MTEILVKTVEKDVGIRSLQSEALEWHPGEMGEQKLERHAKETMVDRKVSKVMKMKILALIGKIFI